MKMTTEEAFVKVLQMHGIEHAFGIIGSAMMPISDIFEPAGITFWDCAHEGSGGFMADGYNPRHRQNVDDDRAKRPRHHQLCDRRQNRLLEPHPASAGHPAGGEQDHRSGRLPGSRADETVRRHASAYQEEVRDPHASGRSPEPRHHAGQRASAPAQINIPRDYVDPGRSTSTCPPSSTLNAPPAAKTRWTAGGGLLSNAKTRSS